MKKTPPKKFIKSATLLSAPKRGKKLQLPKNSRMIPESRLWYKHVDHVFVISFVCGMLLMAIGLATWQLFQDRQQLGVATQTWSMANRELQYWNGIITAHPDYRDAYYHAAIAALRVGEKIEAQDYLTKSLAIDPNFANARIVSQKIQ